ncbi:4-amino-4-deoxychorismate synthase [Kribbella swartbergensis]
MAVGLDDFAATIVDAAGTSTARPRIVAVDGRSGGGKTTLAKQLISAVPRAAVVHVDDVAWNAPMFGWADLLAEGVLEPLRRGEAVSYRPPAWDTHGRPGAVEVPAGLDLVAVEGVGAGRRELADLIDALVWVQSDYAEAERLGIARDIASGVNGDAQASVDFWHDWMAAEIPFFHRDRPWERATIIAAGNSKHPKQAETILIAPPPNGKRSRITRARY